MNKRNKMENKISKAIIGLMTVSLLMTAMFAGVGADVSAEGTLANGSLLFTIEDNDASKITLEVNTEYGDGTNDAMHLYIANKANTKWLEQDITVTDAAANTDEYDVTLGNLRKGATSGNLNGPVVVSDSAAYNVYIAPGSIADADYANFAAMVAAEVLTDEIWIEIVEDTTGRQNLGTNPVNNRFINDYEIEDQDGDDEINPGDTIVLDLELEGDNRYEDMIVSARLLNGNEILSDWQESREFNLHSEQKITLNYEFEMEDIVDIAAQDYKIEVYFDSDDGDFSATYNDFTVELEDDALSIRNVELSKTTVNAGGSLTLTARVYNNGEDEQENIAISAEIAELGVKVEDFDTIGTLGNADYEEWLVTLGIPATARTGDYTLEITAEGDDASTSYTQTITVTSTAVVKDAEFDADETTLDVGSAGATYTLTLENNADTIKTFTLGVEGAEWAIVDLDEEVVIEAGRTKTIQVTVTPKAGETGNKQFTVYADIDGENADEITLNANLTGEDVQEQVIQVLQWVFAVIIIIAIILVIVWAVTKGRKNGEDGAYY